MPNSRECAKVKSCTFGSFVSVFARFTGSFLSQSWQTADILARWVKLQETRLTVTAILDLPVDHAFQTINEENSLYSYLSTCVMERLEKDWITKGLIDFEYKKYVLLAYLQHVRSNFEEARLYPFLSDLVEHYKDVNSLKNRKRFLKSGFPKNVSKIDLENRALTYEQVLEDSELMGQLESIVEYAIPRMKNTLGHGKELYEGVESAMQIEPIGILPLYKNEGYLIMEKGRSKRADIYQYKISNFVMSGEGFRSIYFKFLQSVRRGLGETFEQIKLNLIKVYGALPNPATFLLSGAQAYPIKETVLPVAKRMMLQTVSDLH